LLELERSLDLLTGGGRDLPPRQQTLRRTIDWKQARYTDDHSYREGRTWVMARLLPVVRAGGRFRAAPGESRLGLESRWRTKWIGHIILKSSGPGL